MFSDCRILGLCVAHIGRYATELKLLKGWGDTPGISTKFPGTRQTAVCLWTRIPSKTCTLTQFMFCYRPPPSQNRRGFIYFHTWNYLYTINPKPFCWDVGCSQNIWDCLVTAGREAPRQRAFGCAKRHRPRPVDCGSAGSRGIVPVAVGARGCSPRIFWKIEVFWCLWERF